ncbi:MAG: adenylate kinase family protein [archaeon]
MRISVTGTPGTGKHTIARRLAERLKFELIDLGSFAKEKGLTTPDEERHTLEVNVKKLKELLKDKGDVIFVSNYAELIPADIVFVIRCHPGELVKRLVARNYPFKKVRENAEAECLDYCLQQALEHNQLVAEIDNTTSLQASIQEAINVIDGKNEARYGIVDYLNYVDGLDELILSAGG